MTITSRSWRRALGLTVALVAAVGTLVGANPAQAQTPTGAKATKVCAPVITTIGATVTCDFTVENAGDNPATVAALTEQSPVPGGPIVDVSCTAGAVVINTGDTLAPHTTCLGTIQVTIPDDPTICNTFLTDLVTFLLQYPQFSPPLTAGAFATNSETVICPADITITKTADQLSKVGDSVTYSFEICNVGDVTVNKGTVTDTLLGDLTASFPDTLAPGACVPVAQTRTVLATDPDPLSNTVTATYTSGSGVFATSDTATATASTNLFQPGVGVSKSCTPDPVVVGGVETCTIVVTNTSSADAPGLINGTIVDTLTGDLLAANTAVVSSNCTAVLPSGGTCTIVTQRTVLATDPNPLVNTVTVHYNPEGFPNDITATASASVTVTPPRVVCTLTKGFFRNHPDATAGIIADLGGTLTIGGTALTAAQVQDILNATPGQPGDVTFTSNSLLNLTQQLITTLLNLQGDVALAPAEVQAAIAAVQAGVTITIGAGGQISITTSLSQSEIGSLTATLSSFNEGAFAGFPHCES
jgi:uncharacterized repeat protein (TIGR01451 family)